MTLNAMTLLPTGNIDSYIHAAFQLPILTAEQEYDYAVQLRDKNDLDAARALVMSHIRFVVKIARGYNGYGLPQQDLIQEGSVGLMKAVRRFDPDVGVRLVSFAVHWIRAEMHEFILKNWRIVKVATTKAQRKLFFNLRSSKKRLGWFSQQEINEVAEELGVKPETILEMEQRMSASDMSWDTAIDTDDTKQQTSPANWLPDYSTEPARLLEDQNQLKHNTEKLATALKALDERSRDILEQRWLGERKATLQELADQYQVSAERIRQLEKAAMQSIKASLIA